MPPKSKPSYKGHWSAQAHSDTEFVNMTKWVMRILLLSLSLLTGCSSLPAHVQRSHSQAFSDYASTPLAELTEPRLAGDERSGFRLLPEAASAYMTRIELTRLATRSLDVQYYLLRADDTGRFLMRALRDAAARGVRVRLLVDDFYTAGEDDLLLGLAAHPNVELRLFNPFPAGRDSTLTRFIASANDFDRVNRRMHNKLLVADNAAAVVGGRNMADEYFMRAKGSNFLDLDAFVAGPAVRDLSASFDTYWNSEQVFPIAAIASSTRSLEAQREYFDQQTRSATAPVLGEVPEAIRPTVGLPQELATRRLGPLTLARARVYADAPSKATGTNEQFVQSSLTSETIKWMSTAHTAEGVHLVTPYFIPGDFGMNVLRRVASRIRDRRIEAPWLTVHTNSLASTDEPLVYASYRKYLPELLRLGVRFNELSPSLSVKHHHMGLNENTRGALHMKLVIVDREKLFLGSLNLDQRSARSNTELGIFIDSKELVEYIMPGFDANIGYRVRLAEDGQSLQWSSLQDGKAVVEDTEPETSFWERLKLKLLSPLVAERLL